MMLTITLQVMAYRIILNLEAWLVMILLNEPMRDSMYYRIMHYENV